MKRTVSLLLAAVLAAGLALPASAAGDEAVPVFAPVGEAETTAAGPEEDLLIAPAPDALGTYGYTLVVNGETVDTSEFPQAEGIPMAALARADYRNTYYYEEAGEDSGSFEGGRITVNAETGAVTVTYSDGTVKEFTGAYVGGYSFIPVEAVNSLPGYTAVVNGAVIEVSTPNGAELIKLAHAIMDAAGNSNNMKTELDYVMGNFGVSMDNFEEGYFFGGMSVTPDCLIIAKLAEGADTAAVLAGLEGYRKGQYDTFSWYLAQNLPKVEDAKLVVRKGYAMLLIAEDSDAGLAVFNAAFPNDTYTVQKGDTMGRIAVNFYGSYGYHQALTRANAEAFRATGGRLVPGMVLTLPETLGQAARMEPAEAGAGEKLYTVRLGDTLGKIAAAEYGSMSFCKAVYERNSDRLKDINTIYEGQIIVLPEAKSITVNVVDKDGRTTTLTYKTTARTLGEVLTADGLVKCSEDGMYIETVNGVTADWETDGAMWMLKRNGDVALLGIDSIKLSDGDVYELIYTLDSMLTAES